jgi:hypothetical protein
MRFESGADFPTAASAADGGLAVDIFDDQEGYCRKLGHYVRFSYCRRGPNAGRPAQDPVDAAGLSAPPPAGEGAARACGRIADCWFERLPVEAYLRQNYRPEEIRSILAPPPPKLQSILEIVAQVQSRR